MRSFWIVVNPAAVEESVAACESREVAEETTSFYFEAGFPGPFLIFAPGDKVPLEILEAALAAFEDVAVTD